MLTLTRTKSDFQHDSHALSTEQHTWSMRIVCSSNEPGLGSAIFIMQRGDSESGFQGDTFAAIASIHQMDDLGLVATEEVPYYRTNTLNIDCRSAEEAENLWDIVKQDAGDLVKNHRSKSTLGSTEVFEIV